MNRRTFAATSTTALLGTASAIHAQIPATGPFKLDYAPNFGHFKNSAGEDPLDQIRFMHDHGFRAIEDNGMMGRPPELQQRIGDELARLGMRMGVFVLGFGIGGYKLTCNLAGDKMKGTPDPAAIREEIRQTCQKGLETQKRTGARWCTAIRSRRATSTPP